MDKEIFGKNLCAKYPTEWKFITSQLSDETIYGIITEYTTEYKSLIEELGLVDEHKLTPEEKCIYYLVSLASKKMWSKITKEQVNSLLKAMYDIGASSVTIGISEYEPKEIISTWKKVNEPDNENITYKVSEYRQKWRYFLYPKCTVGRNS